MSALEAMVATLMAQPETWQHLVEHDPGKRRYQLLRRDDELEIWLMGAYEVLETGELRRHSVSYAEELHARRSMSVVTTAS